MSENKQAHRNSDADQHPKKIENAERGLERLSEVMRHILKIPKGTIDKKASKD